jgi:hypothetical protein
MHVMWLRWKVTTEAGNPGPPTPLGTLMDLMFLNLIYLSTYHGFKTFKLSDIT